MSPGRFVGLQNYKNLFKEQFFRMAFQNNLIFVAGSVVAHMGFALLFAYLLFQKVKGAKLFQTVFFLPSVISGTAIGLLWKFIYHPEFGLLNRLLEGLGLEHLQHIWLSEKETVIPALLVVTMWQFVGYHMVIQLAAMRNIPPSLYEAASIDGATSTQQFFRITLPLIKGVLGVDMVLIATGSIKLFDLVFVMTSGGPSHASEVMSTYMYTQGFGSLKFGYSSAIAVALLLVSMVAILVIRLVFRGEEYEY